MNKLQGSIYDFSFWGEVPSGRGPRASWGGGWGSGGMLPRKFFENEYVLRCNLVHFAIETQSCHIVSLDREYLLHVH